MKAAKHDGLTSIHMVAYFLFICCILYCKDQVRLTHLSTNKLCWRNNMIYMHTQGIKVGHAGMVMNLYPVNVWKSTLDLNILILCLISLLWEKKESGNYFQIITEFMTLQSQSQSVWTRRNWYHSWYSYSSFRKTRSSSSVIPPSTHYPTHECHTFYPYQYLDIGTDKLVLCD